MRSHNNCWLTILAMTAQQIYLTYLLWYPAAFLSPSVLFSIFFLVCMKFQKHHLLKEPIIVSNRECELQLFRKPLQPFIIHLIDVNMSREHSPHLNSFSTAEYNQQTIIFSAFSLTFTAAYDYVCVCCHTTWKGKILSYRIASHLNDGVVKCKTCASYLNADVHTLKNS